MLSYGRYITSMFVLIICINTSYAQDPPEGTLDLTQHDFQSDFATLSGNWEFHHGRLIDPTLVDSVKSPEFIRVPGSWHWRKGYPVLGEATYRCRVILPKDENGLLLYLPMITASSGIWVNGELRSTSGRLPTTDRSYKAELTNNFVPLPDSDTIDLVIQAANYSYFSSGLVSTPIIGRSSDLIKEKNLRNGIENVFAGSLIAMFIYQSLLFFLYNRGKPNLWLALICLMVAVRSMTLNGGSFLLPNLFPTISFETWKKLEFGGVYFSVALFPLYIHHLFESSSFKWFLRLFLLISGGLVLTVIFTKQHFYGQLLDVCHVTLVFTFIYAIITIVRSWLRKKSPEAKYIFFGVIASFPFILLEILKNTALVDVEIRFGYLVELGLLVFLIFQVYILARHYANSYKSLEVINKELETEVEERTQELVDSNKIKDRLLSIISHDVKGPLNNLRGLISLHEATRLSPKEFNEFVRQIDDNLSSTNSMVENILFWTARLRKGEHIKIEKFNLKGVLEENIKHARRLSEDKALDITHDLNQDLYLETDQGIVDFVVRNLLANAMKFSHPKGTIEVRVAEKDQQISVAVIDQGIGMSKEQIDKLFETKQVESTQGTAAEQGTGLGLNLVKEYLDEIDGELIISSEADEGSTFETIVPKVLKR